jgi:hypothetical protein
MPSAMQAARVSQARQEVIQSLHTGTSQRAGARNRVAAVGRRPQHGARNPSTGAVTLAPGPSYPYYVRPFSEALVLLDGEATVHVEDRR